MMVSVDYAYFVHGYLLVFWKKNNTFFFLYYYCQFSIFTESVIFVNFDSVDHGFSCEINRCCWFDLLKFRKKNLFFNFDKLFIIFFCD